MRHWRRISAHHIGSYLRGQNWTSTKRSKNSSNTENSPELNETMTLNVESPKLHKAVCTCSQKLLATPYILQTDISN